MEGTGTLGVIASYFGTVESWNLLFRVNLLSLSSVIKVMVVFRTSLP